jgi:hypothetical protein
MRDSKASTFFYMIGPQMVVGLLPLHAGHSLPQENSLYSFLLEAESTQSQHSAGWIRSTEKTNNIRNRTCDLLACNTASQPITLLCASIFYLYYLQKPGQHSQYGNRLQAVQHWDLGLSLKRVKNSVFYMLSKQVSGVHLSNRYRDKMASALSWTLTCKLCQSHENVDLCILWNTSSRPCA